MQIDLVEEEGNAVQVPHTSHVDHQMALGDNLWNHLALLVRREIPFADQSAALDKEEIDHMADSMVGTAEESVAVAVVVYSDLSEAPEFRV